MDAFFQQTLAECFHKNALIEYSKKPAQPTRNQIPIIFLQISEFSWLFSTEGYPNKP